MQATQKREPSGAPRRPRARKSGAVSISGQPLGIPSSITSPDIEALEVGMTAKQIKLARLLTSDPPLSNAEAFRQAYDTELEPNSPTVHRMAHDLCHADKVLALTKLIVATQRERNSAIWMNREQVRLDLANDLRRYALKAEALGDLKSAIAATKAAGETVFVRLFAKAEPDEATQAAGDLVGEMLKKLRGMLVDQPVTVDLMPQLDGEIANTSSE